MSEPNAIKSGTKASLAPSATRLQPIGPAVAPMPCSTFTHPSTNDDSAPKMYAAYHARLFNFLARLSRRRDVAEDLVEETWLRVVAHARAIRDDTRLAPWLFTIARNLFVSYCRSRQLNYEAAAGVHLWPVPSPSPTPFEAAAATQLQQRVEVALATLPGPYREVLLLVGAEGLTPAEAASVCGVKPAAMRQRLSRARAMLAGRRMQGLVWPWRR